LFHIHNLDSTLHKNNEEVVHILITAVLEVSVMQTHI